MEAPVDVVTSLVLALRVLFPVAVGTIAADGRWFRAVRTLPLILVVVLLIIGAIKTESATVNMRGLFLTLVAPRFRSREGKQ